MDIHKVIPGPAEDHPLPGAFLSTGRGWQLDGAKLRREFFDAIKRGALALARPKFSGRTEFSAGHHLPLPGLPDGGFFFVAVDGPPLLSLHCNEKEGEKWDQ